MWIKIFTSKQEAEQTLANRGPRLLCIGANRIALVRLDDELVAVQDFCSHNKESLSKGIVNFKDEIVCPWHGYCFNLRTGRELIQRSPDLKTFPLKISDEGVFINVV
jgi:3-phenylpropionate/trans-cinnamate dioxygenase ferredoxin component